MFAPNFCRTPEPVCSGSYRGTPVRSIAAPALLLSLALSANLSAAPDTSAPSATATFRQFCTGCHGKAAAMGGVNLESMLAEPKVGEQFQQWEKVVSMLESKRMPPPKMRQPDDAQRNSASAWVRDQLNTYAAKHDGEPGRVTVRRLTSAEYAYAVRDLTGLELRFDSEFAGDSVGGEGFTNFGDVQFMQDANLERYLDAAKRVANHAVIGAGPLGFFSDPGRSGFELSAVDRIRNIYAKHGFRAAAGEGGRPFGLERYARAFYAAWRYQHRAALGEPSVTLAKLAAREDVSTRFLEHIWTVVQQPAPPYPVSEAVAKWKALPGPDAPEAKVRTGCAEVQKFVIDWPRFLFAAGELAAGGQGDERALIITKASLAATTTHKFRFNTRNGATRTSKVYLTAVTLNPGETDTPPVLWRNPTVRMRGRDRAFGEPVALRRVLKTSGINFDAEGNFTTKVGQTVELEIGGDENSGGAELQVEAEIPSGGATVLRCTISDKPEVAKGRPVWALLADPDSQGFVKWRSGVLAFAASLPQNSHYEATPSDKDEIPPPFNNTYNQPERDWFHTKLKYYRQDSFLVSKMLDDATRRQLEDAWADLYASFEYHDTFLRFITEKYKLKLKTSDIEALTPADMAAIPAEPRKYIQALRREYDAVMTAQKAGQRGHVEDCIRLAANAWRRPLKDSEKLQLRAFYTKSRQELGLNHSAAVRATLVRTLVAPAFLYRFEPTVVSGLRPLTNQELASRLSFFLWSSIPDAELHKAASAGRLTNPAELERQVKRMLADDKARRFATEFFGQWLGFYRFDEHKGVDAKRFPEFTEGVKSAMYDEAVSFFDHVVRKDRPVREIFTADYTFMNATLGKHYGVNRKELPAAVARFDGAREHGRGGLLRMGAILTATSAPLRTSPVKRGDWVLRRILGTPTPPPPADAGSIPADEKAFGGLSVRERLEVHKRNPTCAGCHTRIDPLGFPFERFDAVGRLRTQYENGKPIEDSTAMADKREIKGIEGLLDYLLANEKQVMRTISFKMVGYALGRTVLASDQKLIERMTESGGDASFAQLATEIVKSKQFRYRRESEPDAAADTSGTSTGGTN